MTTTYCTDADVKVVDGYAERLLMTTDVDGLGAKTFDRHRVRAMGEIDKQLRRREPQVTGAIGSDELRDAEVYLVLAHAYREQASSGTDEDRFRDQARDFETKAEVEIANYRGSEDEMDIGSIGGSIPFERG